MKREFSSLTPQEGLHVAIFIEQRNAQIYQQFAELFAEFQDEQSLEIANVFQDMAEEERVHGTQLQERYLERFGSQPCAVTEDDIRDFIEVPRLDSGDIFAIARSSASRAPRAQALQVALAAEESALRYYARLTEITDDESLRAFYRELADFEDDHVLFLQRKLFEEHRFPSSGVA
jgi:rubrerythrin